MKDVDGMHLVTCEADIEALRNKIMESVEMTVQAVKSRQQTLGTMDSLFELRFHKLGHDPINHTPLNFIEQLNQTFSDLVALGGAVYLLRKYPGRKFILHLGTESGYDIESDDGAIVAECFAVTTVRSNDKLARDSKKLMKHSNCEKKYIFMYSQSDSIDYLNNRFAKYPGICFVPLDGLY